jgi:hypothetical protein
MNLTDTRILRDSRVPCMAVPSKALHRQPLERFLS